MGLERAADSESAVGVTPIDQVLQRTTRRFADAVVPLLATGAVRPVIDRVLPLGAIREAHALLASDATFGKVVLELAP